MIVALAASGSPVDPLSSYWPLLTLASMSPLIVAIALELKWGIQERRASTRLRPTSKRKRRK